MRDFLPQDWVFRSALLKAWETAAETHGFLRYDTPVVDTYELFERKAGEEISEQIYDFRDKSGRHLALRPEITPSMVRLYASNRNAFPFPAKVWSIGQCFRYERMTKARKREHYQWNIDVIGESSMSCEAWLLATAIYSMNILGFGAEDFEVRINSRTLLIDLLNSVGIDPSRHFAVLSLIDKKQKVGQNILIEELAKEGLDRAQTDAVLNFTDICNVADLGQFVDYNSAGVKALRELQYFCEKIGIFDYIRVDTSIVRGLSYYTGIVFEAFDRNREFRAIFGGGRYDGLFRMMTGVDMPSVGLGFGDVVISEIYNSRCKVEHSLCPEVDIVVGAYDPTLQISAMGLASRLSKVGFKCDVALCPLTPKKFFSYASRRSGRLAIFLAPNEMNQGQVVVKNLTKGKQSLMEFDLPMNIMAAKLKEFDDASQALEASAPRSQP
jgi:histidyl-tRNA synthetase